MDGRGGGRPRPWILSGRPLYVEPSLEFTPFIYTPLYFYVAAAVSKVLGVGFLPLRLVSFVASLGCLWLIGRFVRRETGSWTWGIVAAGLFAATYRLSGAWLDIARVDTLFLFLVLGSIHLLRFRRGPLDGGGWAADGLAFLTKQTALFIALPLALYPLLFGRGWARIAFAVAFGGFLIGSTGRWTPGAAGGIATTCSTCRGSIRSSRSCSSASGGMISATTWRWRWR